MGPKLIYKIAIIDSHVQNRKNRNPLFYMQLLDFKALRLLKKIHFATLVVPKRRIFLRVKKRFFGREIRWQIKVDESGEAASDM